ncbi:MAG: UDP-N-acetylmuramoyl-tripeptide--D-alanyl-D-alanine ligase [Oscillospiraceae bacterium]|nr:UDP-N-acetylmuramoyl-tripeptide--D-alanyl-D-alanine ligase [Oscillospiraceae bacterium]
MKMKPITLEKLAEITGGAYVGAALKKFERIESVTMDSRAVERGSLFVCIKGARADGHDFARSAGDNGAVCRLCERPLDDDYPYVLVSDAKAALRALAEWYRKQFTIPVVAIIGSVGKTTAKEMVAAVLGREKLVLKTEANLNNELGVPLTLLKMREEHEAAVVEMGISDFGEMSVLAKMVRPDIVVFTSVGYCHLENLGSLDGVLKAKSEVFDYMAEDAVAVLNGDDDKLASLDPGIKVIRYGVGEECDVRAENIENLGFQGVSCDIRWGNNAIFTLIPAFGTHIVYGALAAAAVGKTLGISAENIMRGIADYRPVGSRANVIDTGKITIIDDCYNANPNSMAAAIRSLSSINALTGKTGKRIAILGDMKELGRDSGELHRDMGEEAARVHLDLVVAIGPEAKRIAEGMKNGGGNAVWLSDKSKLFPAFEKIISRGDVVLVKASHSMGFDEITERLKRL